MVALTPVQVRDLLEHQGSLLDAGVRVSEVNGHLAERRLRLHVTGRHAFVADLRAESAEAWRLQPESRPDEAPTQRGSDEERLEVCRQIETCLRVAGADWPSYPAPPAREVLPRAEALRRLGEEAGALRPWLDYVEPLAGPIQFSLQREPVEAVLLTLPRVPAHLQARYEYLLRTHCLPGSPQGPPWLSQLGFGADGSGLVTTFPSPAGFVRLVRALRGTGPAWRPALVAMNGALAWERPWLEAMAQGTALINMPARTGVWLRVVARQAAVTRRLSMLRRHLHGLLVIPAHDLTQHCVLQHAVPADHVAALGEPVLRLLRDAPGPAAPKPLVILMDTDLPQACQRAWQACLVPEDFAIAWRREWPGLHDLLRERAAQTRRLGRLAGWYLGRHDPRDQQLALS